MLLTLTSRVILLGERRGRQPPHLGPTKELYQKYSTAWTALSTVPLAHTKRKTVHDSLALNAKLLASPTSTFKHCAPIKEDTSNKRKANAPQTTPPRPPTQPTQSTQPPTQPPLLHPPNILFVNPRDDDQEYHYSDEDELGNTFWSLKCFYINTSGWALGVWTEVFKVQRSCCSDGFIGTHDSGETLCEDIIIQMMIPWSNIGRVGLDNGLELGWLFCGHFYAWRLDSWQTGWFQLLLKAVIFTQRKAW